MPGVVVGAFSSAGFSGATSETLHSIAGRFSIGVAAPTGFVSPAAVDVDGIRAVALSDACNRGVAEVDELVGDRAFIVRVDRMELSKNILRGFLAFDELLDGHPEWRERVVFGAFVYPSREGLAEYQAYHAYGCFIRTAWSPNGITSV